MKNNSYVRTNSISPFVGSATVGHYTDGTDDYLVAPGILSIEDVYSYPRANGPGAVNELLPSETIANSVDDWNGVPLLLDHPRDENGHATTIENGIDDPVVIGEIRSPETRDEGEETRLRGEAWVDTTLAREIDGGEAVIEALEEGHIVETSAAYRANRDLSRGTLDGVSYDAVQTAVLNRGTAR